MAIWDSLGRRGAGISPRMLKLWRICKKIWIYKIGFERCALIESLIDGWVNILFSYFNHC